MVMPLRSNEIDLNRYDYHEPGGSNVQWRTGEVMTVAFDLGYFEIPREVEIKGLIRYLGISYEPIKNRLNRGLRILVEEYGSDEEFLDDLDMNGWQTLVISTALDEGFFEKPRKISMEELLGEVGVSSFENPLRRAIKTIVDHYFGESFLDETGLTRRQYQTLCLAQKHGYFEWPREVEQRDLAIALGVEQSTFQEIFRAALRKLLNHGVFNRSVSTSFKPKKTKAG